MPADSMIQAEGLKKHYGETVALAGIDLEVPPAPSSACWDRTVRERRPLFAS